MNHYSRYMNNISPQLDLSPSSQASTNRLAPTPLKLNNIGMLLRQLKYTDENTRFLFFTVSKSIYVFIL